ncbi:hypothetical protein ANO11243_037920 [Dothideomycetidae sp. 11243]|nr:hypothetical protein ANO11243_037920 [fungal sp. No.11243]
MAVTRLLVSERAIVWRRGTDRPVQLLFNGFYTATINLYFHFLLDVSEISSIFSRRD